MMVDSQPKVLYIPKSYNQMYESGRGNEVASNISEHAAQICEGRLDKEEKDRKALLTIILMRMSSGF